jgi:hypothetical protein
MEGGKISSPPLAMLKAAGIDAAEAVEVAHGGARGGINLWVNQWRHPSYIPERLKQGDESRPQGIGGKSS